MPTDYVLQPRASNRLRLASDGDSADAQSMNRALIEVGELSAYPRTLAVRSWQRELLLSGAPVGYVAEGLGPLIGGVRQSMLAVAAGASIYLSIEGEGWGAVAAPTEAHAVAYSPQLALWACVGVHAASSPLGNVWTARTTPSSALLRALVVDAAGAFVAVGDVANDQGYILHSADGVVWEQQTCPVAEGMRALAYGSGMLVAVGGSAGAPRTVYSENGLDWYEGAPSAAIADTLEGVAWDGTWFVARDAAGRVMRSMDGMDWETTQAAPLGAAPDGGHVAADPETGAVIACAAGYGQIQVSYDHGESFQPAAWLAASAVDAAPVIALSFARGRFFAGSTRGTLHRSLAR